MVFGDVVELLVEAAEAVYTKGDQSENANAGNEGLDEELGLEAHDEESWG